MRLFVGNFYCSHPTKIIKSYSLTANIMDHQLEQASSFDRQGMSRLEEFLSRLENGEPYGTHNDIGMLIDEIVKRLERRVISTLENIQIRVQQNESELPATKRTSLPASSTSPPASSMVRKISKSNATLEPNQELLNHDVQDLVQDVVMTSMERLMETAKAEMKTDHKQKPKSGPVFRPSGVVSDAYKTHETKPDRDILSKYARGIDSDIMPIISDDDDEEAEAIWRSTKRESLETGRTAADRHKYSSENDSRMASTGTSSFKPKFSAAPQEITRTGGNSKVLKRLGEKDPNVSTNYTYTLRSSVKRSIPKYLQKGGLQSQAAVMNMFNAIRFGMADESIENLIAEALAEAVSSGKEEARDIDGVEKGMSPKETVKTPTGTRKLSYQADGGRNYFETRSWANREQANAGQQSGMGQSGTGKSSITTEKPRFVQKLGEKDQNVSTNYTYTLRSSVKRSIPKYLQKGGLQSQAAVMNMFNAIRFGMADESIETLIADALAEVVSSGKEDRDDGKKGMSREKTVKSTTETRKLSFQADGGRKYFENRSWANREQTSAGRQAGMGQSGTGRSSIATEELRNARVPKTMPQNDNVPTMRMMAPKFVSHYVQKGSAQNAVLSMADHIRTDGWNQRDYNKFFGNEQSDVSYRSPTPTVPKSFQQPNMKKRKVDFVNDTVKSMPIDFESWRAVASPIDEAAMRYDANMTYVVRKALRRSIPKFTNSKDVSGAILNLSGKLLDEFSLQSLSNMNIALSEKEKPGKGVSSAGSNDNRKNDNSEDLPWVTKGKNASYKADNSICNDNRKNDNSEDLPWVTKGKNASYKADDSEDLPWVTKGQNAEYAQNVCPSCDVQWVNQETGKTRIEIPAYELPSESVSTQTSLRALHDDYVTYPQTVTAGRGWNKNTNQSRDTLNFSSEDSIHDEIFYDALSTQADLQIKSDYQDDEMSFLKRFRLNLLFRKKKVQQKKFVSAVHKVIEARRSGCIDNDGNFVQTIPTPTPLDNVDNVDNVGQKSPPPQVKPKPNKSLDKNGNKRASGKKRGSSRRRHNPDRESYPLPEEDDGSEGYASASEMDNFEFNPTAFLERNRRSADQNRFHRDDGTDADVESDSDGANSSNRRVRFSDDVQHFGAIAALAETDSSEPDDEPDISLMSLKSKIELFEKVSSNEFLDERSFQGSPPPDIPENISLPTKDRVQLFEDISKGKKPTTSHSENKTPRRAVESCQYTETQSKISFFEHLSENANCSTNTN